MSKKKDMFNLGLGDHLFYFNIIYRSLIFTSALLVLFPCVAA